MRTLSIESNGRLENTAIYINGEQIAGIRELYINIDEQGTFDSVISYIDGSGKLLSKQLFTDDIQSLQFKEAAFTEEDSLNLIQLTIESNGDLENTSVFINDDYADGIVSLTLHCKLGESKPQSLFEKFLSKANPQNEESFFRSEIIFRNEDGSLTNQSIF